MWFMESLHAAFVVCSTSFSDFSILFPSFLLSCSKLLHNMKWGREKCVRCTHKIIYLQRHPSFLAYTGETVQNLMKRRCMETLLRYVMHCSAYKVHKMIPMIKNKKFLKRGTSWSLIITKRRWSVRLIYQICCCWAPQNFCGSWVLAFHSFWPMKCFGVSNSDFDFCIFWRCRKYDKHLLN